MSDIVSTSTEHLSTRWLWRIAWAAGAAVCAVAMTAYPTRETIPYHLIWIGLSLVYGYAVWRPRELAIMVAVTATVTGAIMLHQALIGRIDWLETAEVPLSVTLIAVIAAHIRRRHLALAELAAAADDDRRQAEMRQHLMRQISHELRTPITVARGYTELLRERHIDAATAEQTTIVLDELDKVADITRRLITMIQMDGPYAPEPLDLDAELARIVRRWTPTADRIWQTASTPGQVYANRNRLEAALDCLLDNAVKFTQPGDTIRVTATIDRNEWTIEAADTGRGMTADPRHTDQSGTGLGLSMVRALVHSWGGSMSVTDHAGGGTAITMRFPTASLVERATADVAHG
jgi:two-component system, OmpR family, sensor kinase